MFLAGSQQMGAFAGPRHLLADVTLSLFDGDKVGILGPNGAGKSTLMRLLLGEQPVDSGSISRTRGVESSSLAQHHDFPAHFTVKQAMLGERSEYEWQSSPQLREISTGLLGEVEPDASVATLSGGQLRRLALAATLAAPSQILALDEPTNHLDLEAVSWLAEYLKNRFRGDHGALLVVTHDRWFLDEVCNTIWEVVPGVDHGGGRPQIPGHVEVYEGSYAAYILARAERARMASVAEEKRQNLLRKELAWLRRGAPARTSKPRFRINAAEALINDVPPPRDQVELVKMATARMGKKVVELENISFSYGDKAILKDVTWRLSPGERVGIIGINGAGKSTLLQILQGVIEPQDGHVSTGKTVQLGCLAQHVDRDSADEPLRVVEAVSRIKERIAVGKGEITAAQLVERLGFTKERAWTPVMQLSGGEKRRLQLVCELMKEPNLLLLDEPTNDLDTDTLAQLESLLDSFPGTLVVVSHDRYLLERVTDHQLALLPDGRLLDLAGGVEQYLQWRKDGRITWSDSNGGVTSAANSASVAKTTEKKAGAQSYAQSKTLKSLEKRITKFEQQIADLDQQLIGLAAAGNTQELAQLQNLHEQREDLARQLEELENQWLELAD